MAGQASIWSERADPDVSDSFAGPDEPCLSWRSAELAAAAFSALQAADGEAVPAAAARLGCPDAADDVAFLRSEAAAALLSAAAELSRRALQAAVSLRSGEALGRALKVAGDLWPAGGIGSTGASAAASAGAAAADGGEDADAVLQAMRAALLELEQSSAVSHAAASPGSSSCGRGHGWSALSRRASDADECSWLAEPVSSWKAAPPLPGAGRSAHERRAITGEARAWAAVAAAIHAKREVQLALQPGQDPDAADAALVLELAQTSSASASATAAAAAAAGDPRALEAPGAQGKPSGSEELDLEDMVSLDEDHAPAPMELRFGVPTRLSLDQAATSAHAAAVADAGGRPDEAVGLAVLLAAEAAAEELTEALRLLPLAGSAPVSCLLADDADTLGVAVASMADALASVEGAAVPGVTDADGSTTGSAAAGGAVALLLRAWLAHGRVALMARASVWALVLANSEAEEDAALALRQRAVQLLQRGLAFAWAVQRLRFEGGSGGGSAKNCLASSRVVVWLAAQLLRLNGSVE
ncbi:hypothetical protein FNF27_03147 [Cafeteria roenbergensis]|uniref:Uncharacterized protein n=1 Tax=Cafeteria roenbergensis TaxID=33653 RepID=A0A5A8EFE3_CAFRO|nr:hypothetical protein FNF27_03147 [Cafeteria roenbergensis]